MVGEVYRAKVTGSRSGRNHPYAKMDEDAVRELRKRRVEEKVSFAVLGRQYGITRQAAWLAFHGHTWKAV